MVTSQVLRGYWRCPFSPCSSSSDALDERGIIICCTCLSCIYTVNDLHECWQGMSFMPCVVVTVICVCVCVCVGVSRAAFIHRGGGEGLGKSLKVLSVAAAFEGVLWGCGVGRLPPPPPPTFHKQKVCTFHSVLNVAM